MNLSHPNSPAGAPTHDDPYLWLEDAGGAADNRKLAFMSALTYAFLVIELFAE